MTHDEIQAALSGPIASIRTPFNEDGSIDHDGLRRMVEFDIQAGVGGLLITWGDSLFSLLGDQDIADLTKAVVGCAAGRVPVVACTGRWGTPQAVDFASFCRNVGVDILQTFLPMWYPACLTPDAILEHHKALAEHIPVMANSAELQRSGPAEGRRIAETLIQDKHAVLAMKGDVTGAPDREITTVVREDWVMLAGGQKSFHMELWPYGCRGYLSTFGTFRPSVTRAYWAAIDAGDTAAATRIIEKIDRPFFNHILAMPGGFDAAMHGIAEICGLAKRWRRSPFYSLSDEELEALQAFLEDLADAEKDIREGT